MYFLLTSFDSVFECKDPLKFYNNLKIICEEKGESLNATLSYYFHNHYISYLYHKDMQRGDLVFSGDPNILSYAENMTEVFKNWIPIDELILSAGVAYEQIISSLNEEE